MRHEIVAIVDRWIVTLKGRTIDFSALSPEAL
jgi:hypothetical protein